MIDTLTGFVEKNWTRPYEVATSLLGLLLIFGSFRRPLATASEWLAAVGAGTWSDALTTADKWALSHPVDGLGDVGLIGVTAAAGFAALTVTSLPTRSGGTFWIFASIAVYGGEGLGTVIASTLLGLILRFVYEWTHTTIDDALATSGWSLLDVALGALWLPLVVLLWIFMPRGGFTMANPG
jgi:hypothetical protein